MVLAKPQVLTLKQVVQQVALLDSDTVVLPWFGLEQRLDDILGHATKNVRPSNDMIERYNDIGRLPWGLGTALLLTTSIDTLKIVVLAGVLGRTDAALQVIYRYKPRQWRLSRILKVQHWLESFNCRSIRARGEFVQKAAHYLLSYLVQNHASHNGHEREFTVVSLGSGSASQLLEGVADNGLGVHDIHVILVDRDPRALEVGRINVDKLELGPVVELREVTVGKFLRQIRASSVDFVEMVGLADYFDNEQLARYLRGICTALAPGGLFLGANISSKEEASFAHEAGRWPKMQYRSREQLVAMLEIAGFGAIWTGSCGLYTVWVASAGEREERQPLTYDKIKLPFTGHLKIIK